MRISSLTTMAVRVPLKVPAKWSGGTRETAPAVLVRIDTDEGITGWGECVGPTLPAIQALVQAEFAPLLLEQDPLRVEFLVHRMDEHSVNWDAIGRYGISGVEMALLDIKGKAFGVPVAELLGGFYRREVEWMGYLFIEAPHVNARQAATDVQERRRLPKEPAGIAGAIPARRDERSNQRKANLSAVIVPGEHQVEAVAARPAELIGRVGEEDPQRDGRVVRRQERRVAEPGKFGPGEQHFAAAEREPLDPAGQIGDAGGNDQANRRTWSELDCHRGAITRRSLPRRDLSACRCP